MQEKNKMADGSDFPSPFPCVVANLLIFEGKGWVISDKNRRKGTIVFSKSSKPPASIKLPLPQMDPRGGLNKKLAWLQTSVLEIPRINFKTSARTQRRIIDKERIIKKVIGGVGGGGGRGKVEPSLQANDRPGERVEMYKKNFNII